MFSLQLVCFIHLFVPHSFIPSSSAVETTSQMTSVERGLCHQWLQDPGQGSLTLGVAALPGRCEAQRLAPPAPCSARSSPSRAHSCPIACPPQPRAPSSPGRQLCADAGPSGPRDLCVSPCFPTHCVPPVSAALLPGVQGSGGLWKYRTDLESSPCRCFTSPAGRPGKWRCQSLPPSGSSVWTSI